MRSLTLSLALAPGLVPVVILAVAVLPAVPESPPKPSSKPAIGRVTGCDHFAFLRASMDGGLGGPALEALKSWDGESAGTFGPNGEYYQIDVNNSILLRIQGGQARVLAGNGTRGWRDGPADQAMFDFGVGSYSDAGIACDSSGNILVSEAQAGRLRRIFRRPDGIWWVTTLAGGGSYMPEKGKRLPARQMKIGCASRFALGADDSVYFASYGGIYQLKDGKGTLLAGSEELRKQLGKRTAIHDWHVGGSHITAEGVFTWMPGGGPDLLRYDTRTGKAQRVAGIGRVMPGLDGPTLLTSGFHTVLICYSPDASVMYTCGGDESVPRRIHGGRVATLRRDGSFKPCPEKPNWRQDDRWRNMAAVQCLDSHGRLYAFTGDYGWGGWVVRFTFESSD